MKNIMLLFLSNLHLEDTHKLKHTIYQIKDDTSLDCVQTNESAVRYLAHELGRTGEKLDALFLFSTNLVRKPVSICDDDGIIRQYEQQQDFFEQRIEMLLPELHGHIYTVDYETKDAASLTDDAAEESIRQVVSMAEKIKQYTKEYLEEEVCIHADMTGGFRHASMMMLDVMQILKFSGIHIGRVVYSDLNTKSIIDVTEVQHLFTLISGAEEFVNYGSVLAIESYFKDISQQQSRECLNLISAMKQFSDAIKICQIDTIEKVLKTLDSKIVDFQQHNPKTLQEDMFSQLLGTVRQGYHSLISSSPSRLDIIDWCAKKGFLQQAMTMCTEWLPTIIVDSHICYPVDPAVKGQMEREKLHHSWQQSFIATYNKAQYVAGQKDTLRNNIAALFGKLLSKQFITHDDIVGLGINSGKLAAYIDEVQLIDQKLKKLRLDMNSHRETAEKCMGKLFQQNPIFAQLMRYSYYKIGTTYVKDFSYFLMNKVSQELVLKRLQGMSMAEMEAMFKIPDVQKDYSPRKPGRITLDDKWDRRYQQYDEMFCRQIIATRYERKYAIDILRRYFYIREQRNEINHVNETSAALPEVIRKDIEDFVCLLRNQKDYVLQE